MKDFVMRPVKSSNLKNAGYDFPSRTLYIEFLSGGVYLYRHVGPTRYRQLRRARSKGKFFHRFIRNNYPYERFYPTKSMLQRAA